MTANTIILLTGASKGIGRATAIALATQGITLVLTARSVEKLEAVAHEVETKGGTAIVIPADLGNPLARTALVQETFERVGNVDVLINNAGLGMEEPVGNIDLEDARQLFEVNFFAVLDLIQQILPRMKARGTGQIVNVSSIVGHRATPHQSVYCATKYALNGLSDGLRTELVDTKIVVTDIYPGVTATNFPANQLHSQHIAKRRNAVPPERVAAVIADAIRKPRRSRYVTWKDQILIYGTRLFPWWADQVLGRGYKRIRKY